jgi:hypothetical protein
MFLLLSGTVLAALLLPGLQAMFLLQVPDARQAFRCVNDLHLL